MSAEAVANLRQIWEKLTIHRVSRVIAREPEDVLLIDVRGVAKAENGFHYLSLQHYDGARHTQAKRLADIPAEERFRANVAWRHFYGFTDDGIYFNRDDAHGPDCSIDLTMRWSEWSNNGHKGTFDKPKIGSLIAGVVIDTPRGKRFEKWFKCSPEFAYLLDVVRNGTKLSENELAAKLITSAYPDEYWAIARLLLFDNAQAFVDELKEREQRPSHSCFGQEYGESWYLEPNAPRPRVNWTGMYLPMRAPKFVHTISHTLGEPKWWAEFKRLAAEQKLEYDHPGWGNYCLACSEERKKALVASGDYPLMFYE